MIKRASRFILITLIASIAAIGQAGENAADIESAASVEATEAQSQPFADQPLIQAVIQTLELDPRSIKADLVASKPSLENPDEVIVVIPEIVDEGEQYFELNSHIVLADKRTGKITHRFFESSQTNQWFSDAIVLSEISIDTAPYRVNEGTRAFGVLVSYYGMSRVNPYELKTLSLFIKADDGLTKVLADYPVKKSAGEWDGDCLGTITDTDNLFIITPQKTNGFYDLLVKSKITESKSAVNESGECEAADTVTREKTTLKFDGQQYRPVNS